MKKTAAVLCVALLALTFSACSNRDSTDSTLVSDSTSDSILISDSADAQQILDEVLSNIDENTLDAHAYYSDEAFQNNAKKLYSVEADKLSDGGILYDSSGSTADEISLIKPADGDCDSMENMLAARRDMRERDFTGYKPDEVGKIENAVIFSQNGWSVLIISDNADSIAQTIKALL